jgi:3-dehydroquinate synthase
MQILPIKASRDYLIYLGRDILATALPASLLPYNTRRLVLFVDEHLVDTHALRVQQQLQAHGLSVELLICPSGEVSKTRETKHALEDALLQKQLGRDSCFLALGGGVVTDLVGFLAATYARGVPVIYLPTTLLAMVDASIGGKTGVNTSFGKNLIGTITPPHAVIMDIQFLESLPERELRNGVVEMLKHALIADADLFMQLSQQSTQSVVHDRDSLLTLIAASCRIKQAFIERDEHEQQARFILNFGHTIGHAIELIEEFSVSHGEAVAIGLLVECYLSQLPLEQIQRLRHVLEQYGLPLRTKAFEDLPAFYAALRYDKKSQRGIPQFVLLQEFGRPHPELMQVEPEQLADALAWIAPTC